GDEAGCEFCARAGIARNNAKNTIASTATPAVCLVRTRPGMIRNLGKTGVGLMLEQDERGMADARAGLAGGKSDPLNRRCRCGKGHVRPVAAGMSGEDEFVDDEGLPGARPGEELPPDVRGRDGDCVAGTDGVFAVAARGAAVGAWDEAAA